MALFMLLVLNELTSHRSGNSYRRGRISTVDLLVLTSLDKLLFTQKILLFFFYKTSYSNKEVNRTEPSPSVSAPRKDLYKSSHANTP
jgi:hypothetical protein